MEALPELMIVVFGVVALAAAAAFVGSVVGCVLVGVVALCRRSLRSKAEAICNRFAITGMCACAAAAGSSIATAFCDSRVDVERERSLRSVDESTRPLVAALERHRADCGEYPAHLDQLVPKYLSAVPQTGVPFQPAFEYARGSDEFGLSVRCSPPWFAADAFRYSPDMMFPRARSGDWVWLDDD